MTLIAAAIAIHGFFIFMGLTVLGPITIRVERKADDKPKGIIL